MLWSPSTSRWAAGHAGAGVTSTLRPMSEASTRRTPVREELPQHDRVLDLAVLDPAALGDRGERADVGVADHRAGADDRPGRRSGCAVDLGARLDPDPADDLAGLVDLAVDAGSMVSSTERLTSSMSVTLPVSFQ